MIKRLNVTPVSLLPLALGLLALAAVGCGDNLPAQVSTGSAGSGASGASGAAGSEGTAGTSGTAGVSGMAGMTGTAGTSGTAGDAGAAGDGGTAGDAGVAGGGGVAGNGGGAGDGGLAGDGGVAGADGAAGVAGTDGGPDANEGGAGTSGAAGMGGSGGGGAGGLTGGAGGPGGQGGTIIGCDGVDCTLGSGAMGVCINGICSACPSDAKCQELYGQNFLCIGGECLSGNCRTTADCAPGQLCDVATNLCGACASDAACIAGLGADHVCINGACVTGTCHDAGDCASGMLCTAAHTCDVCPTDASCVAAYGTGFICAAGACLPGDCHVTADCAAGQVCDQNTRLCGSCASDAACLSSYGPAHLCVGGSCIAGDCRAASACSGGRICVSNSCTDCATDQTCEAQYGADHLCVSGGCVTGECRTASDCATGQLCDLSFHCTGCTTDNACVSGLGANHLCVNNLCRAGDCRATAECGGGRICDTNAFTCVACQSDASCVTGYGADHLCVNGNCIAGTCRVAGDCAAGELCDANTFMCTTCATDASCVAGYGPDHLCISGACVAGQCRASPECPNGGLCNTTNHLCGPCATDPQCVSGYGMNHLCDAGQCVSGTCHTTAECGGGQICNLANHLCQACANDAGCVAAYGAGHLCEANVCIVGQCRASADCSSGKICDTPTHTCVACQNDNACQTDSSYGTSTFCLSGACTPGDCRNTGDCASGQLCGSSEANTCGACVIDAQCTGDPAYGAGNICFEGICQQGDCHSTSADCTGGRAGLVCGAVAANRCGACSSDQQCQEDPVYGSSMICNTTPAQATTGRCVSSACNVSGACPANGGDFCCSSLCVPGNCCADADCTGNPAFGVGTACIDHQCTGCSAVTGNKYLVDPVNGNDAKATGSGLIGSVANSACSFKTVTRALQVAGGFAAPGTQIVIIGQSGMSTPLAGGETLPILVPANVTITTRDGPVSVALPASSDPSFSNVAGFQLAGDLSGINPDPSAPLTIDGSSNTSGIGIGVSPGVGKSASLTYVTVQNTGGNGITVTNGIFNVGQGVTVKGAGTATKRRDGLNVTSGTARIVVTAGQAPTSFLNNTQHGIYVSGSGLLNIVGVPVMAPAPNGQGTVVVSGNFAAGVHIFETPGAGASSINGVTAWANTAAGLRIYGGSKLKVRNSVFLANGTSGVYVAFFNASMSGNDLSQIDLGTVADPGHNVLQALLGSNPDITGLCVSMWSGMGPLTLRAAGNTFAGPVDCSMSTAPLVRAPTCSGFVDIGVVTALGTTVTVDAAGCN